MANSTTTISAASTSTTTKVLSRGQRRKALAEGRLPEATQSLDLPPEVIAEASASEGTPVEIVEAPVATRPPASQNPEYRKYSGAIERTVAAARRFGLYTDERDEKGADRRHVDPRAVNDAMALLWDMEIKVERPSLKKPGEFYEVYMPAMALYVVRPELGDKRPLADWLTVDILNGRALSPEMGIAVKEAIEAQTGEKYGTISLLQAVSELLSCLDVRRQLDEQRERTFTFQKNLNVRKQTVAETAASRVPSLLERFGVKLGEVVVTEKKSEVSAASSTSREPTIKNGAGGGKVLNRTGVSLGA